MRHRESRHALLAMATLLALIALSGCATVPPPPFAPVDTPPDTVRSEPSTLMPTGKRIPAPAPVAVAPRSYAPADSLPSPEALAVLDSLPEPLAPEERFRARRRPAIAAIVDSSAIPIQAEPVPAAADSCNHDQPTRPFRNNGCEKVVAWAGKEGKGWERAMKIVGIIIGILGTVLFLWHVAKVVAGTDIDSAFMSHKVLSLVGGIMILAGTWMYAIGRRKPQRR